MTADSHACLYYQLSQQHQPMRCTYATWSRGWEFINDYLHTHSLIRDHSTLPGFILWAETSTSAWYRWQRKLIYSFPLSWHCRRIWDGMRGRSWGSTLTSSVSLQYSYTYMIAKITFTVLFLYDRTETLVWAAVIFLSFTRKTAVACTSSQQTHFILSIYLPTAFGTVICFSSKKRYWYLNKWGLQLHTWSSINHIDPTAEVSTKSKTRLLQTCTPLWYRYENVSRA